MCGIFCSYNCADNECLLKESHKKRLLNRGPDHQETIAISDQVVLSAFILHVQGNSKQPCSRNRKHLVYNGQNFCCPKDYSSDTDYLMDLVDRDGVLATADHISGPCSAVLYDENTDCLWFWRDYFGRRSLLLTKPDDQGRFLLSSVGDRLAGDWVEVPAVGVFCVEGGAQVTCYPYLGRQDKCEAFCETFFSNYSISESTLRCPVSPLNMTPVTTMPADWEAECQTFLKLLSEAVRIREQCCGQPLSYSQEFLSDYSSRHCYCSSPTLDECDATLEECDVHATLEECVPSGARVGVLFSGGIDCTVLAYLLHSSVPPGEAIDLINVSFGNYNSTPDRISAAKSLEDLQTTCPGRTWNLIKVNVTVSQLQESRDRYITDLVYPHNTVIDDSIGCALWFAARGVGLCGDRAMFSTARLLFSGIGADELLGGYSRHRGAGEKDGLAGACREINLDINRISERNLGRDNRVIGDHRRDCVAPFLDEDFVSFVNSLPIQFKVDFSLPRGEGEKIILRKVAAKLGLSTSSVLPKKAIQFGSKIAKLEGRKEKGGDVCSRLTPRA